MSEAPKEVQVQKKYDSRRELDEFKSDEQKKEELLTAMVNKMSNYDEPLPQDLQEGVDEDEWVSTTLAIDRPHYHLTILV